VQTGCCCFFHHLPAVDRSMQSAIYIVKWFANYQTSYRPFPFRARVPPEVFPMDLAEKRKVFVPGRKALQIPLFRLVDVVLSTAACAGISSKTHDLACWES
jgi:hypothetical protein